VLLSMTFAAALLVSPQDAAVAPPVPPAPAAPSAEEMALIARVEAAGEAMEATMETLTPQAEAVRIDASLSADEKETRIRALMAEHQPVFDAFGEALHALILDKAAADGASPQEAAEAAAMIRASFAAQMTQALITGQDPDPGE
jgi:hypothetical protein